MLRVYDHYKMFVYSYSAGIDFRRQNLTSADVRFWRLKSIPVLQGLNTQLSLTLSCLSSYPISLKWLCSTTHKSSQCRHLKTVLSSQSLICFVLSIFLFQKNIEQFQFISSLRNIYFRSFKWFFELFFKRENGIDHNSGLSWNKMILCGILWKSDYGVP